MSNLRTETKTLIGAMKVLARDIQSGDGVANMAILEAAQRLEEQEAQLSKLPMTVEGVRVVPTMDDIYINPVERGGWQHEGALHWHRWDENNELRPIHPVKITRWAHYGDHFWVAGDSPLEEGDYWWGKIYATKEACDQAMKEGDSNGK